MATNPLRIAEEQAARHQHPLMPHGHHGNSLVPVIEHEYRLYLPDYLYTEYWVRRKTCRQIGDELGVNPGTVHLWLKQLGLNRDAILDRAARQLQEDPGWAVEGQDAWKPPRDR